MVANSSSMFEKKYIPRNLEGRLVEINSVETVGKCHYTHTHTIYLVKLETSTDSILVILHHVQGNMLLDNSREEVYESGIFAPDFLNIYKICHSKSILLQQPLIDD